MHDKHNQLADHQMCLCCVIHFMFSIYIFKPILKDIAAQQEVDRQKEAGAGAAPAATAAVAAVPPGSASAAKR
jgi:hypothetical protein